ncbi:MAG: hypothetical protein ACFFD1_15555 [Candidatus Thorarchaeota archaeon]
MNEKINLIKDHGGIKFIASMPSEVSQGDTVAIKITFFNPFDDKLLFPTYFIKDIKEDKFRGQKILPLTLKKDKFWFPRSGEGGILPPKAYSHVWLPLIINQEVFPGDYKLTSFIYTESKKIKDSTNNYKFGGEKRIIPENWSHLKFSVTKGGLIENPVQKFLSITPFKMKLDNALPLFIRETGNILNCYLKTTHDSLVIKLKIEIIPPEKIDETFSRHINQYNKEIIDKIEEKRINDLDYTIIKTKSMSVNNKIAFLVIYLVMIKNNNAIGKFEFQLTENYPMEKIDLIVNELSINFPKK